MWAAITGLLAEIKRCEAAGATTAAVAVAYVCIDTMAFLSLPVNQDGSSKAPNWRRGSGPILGRLRTGRQL